jgi:hypothetical protein
MKGFEARDDALAQFFAVSCVCVVALCPALFPRWLYRHLTSRPFDPCPYSCSEIQVASSAALSFHSLFPLRRPHPCQMSRACDLCLCLCLGLQVICRLAGNLLPDLSPQPRALATTSREADRLIVLSMSSVSRALLPLNKSRCSFGFRSCSYSS